MKFASKHEAIQYLSDLTGSRVRIAKKVPFSVIIKALEGKYEEEKEKGYDLIEDIVKTDPTAKVVAHGDEKAIKGSYVMLLVEWIKKGLVNLRSESDKVKDTLQQYHEWKQMHVPEIVRTEEKLFNELKEKGPDVLEDIFSEVDERRPDPADYFSHMDDHQIGQAEKYRVFQIDNHSDMESIMCDDDDRWCVIDEHHWETYEPPFFVFTKGNNYFALLNPKGVKNEEEMSFGEWREQNEEHYLDDVIDELKEGFEPDDYYIDQEHESYYNNHIDEDDYPEYSDWDETQEASNIRESIEQNMKDEYEPDEDEISYRLEAYYESEDLETLQRIEYGGVEFNNAGNVPLSKHEAAVLIPVMEDAFVGGQNWQMNEIRNEINSVLGHYGLPSLGEKKQKEERAEREKKLEPALASISFDSVENAIQFLADFSKKSIVIK